MQLRGDAFTFADAEDVLDYLDDLGVSHLYLSPILTAVEGSTHGYDVTDPTTVSAALGGREGLEQLSACGTGPRHGTDCRHRAQPCRCRDTRAEPVVVGRARARPESTYCSFFDIDWDLDPDGRIVLPVLGSDRRYHTAPGPVIRARTTGTAPRCMIDSTTG